MCACGMSVNSLAECEKQWFYVRLYQYASESDLCVPVA